MTEVAEDIVMVHSAVPWIYRRRVRKAAVYLARHLAASGNGDHEYNVGDDNDDIRITVRWVRKNGKEYEDKKE